MTGRVWPQLVVIVVGLYVLYEARAVRRDAGTVPPEAVAYHGAMELYQSIAAWAGRRAMEAERRYREMTLP